MELDEKDDSIKDISIENLTSPSSPDVSNVFGEPVLIPRVGEKYQAEIPSMIEESERLELLANPLDSRALKTSLAFLLGSPIPIMWVLDDDNCTEDRESGSLRKLRGTINVINRPSEARNGKKSQSCLRNKSSENGSKSYNPVPGLKTCEWSEDQVDIFLLGLYIFGKNFFQIARFMGNDDLGAIQSFYYGNFYRTDEYRRWSRSRKKVRRKKCVIGRKIFTGWRQQELLSRLSSRVSEEPHKSLVEGYKLFTEGQTSFEDYISLLKSIAGVALLVEVIGIGKGKEDLTSIEMDIGRTNQDIGTHLPTGQDCSSLTTKEIVNLLTGGFRLSKGRCSDIFWDAVWPRLLAKGWHSEQPKDQGYVSSKKHLVFLVPGIKKFSRRKLTKGEHYFDSVSDVLNRVASEPKLIELESEENGARDEKNGWSPETGSDQDDQSGPRRCYLKPRVSTSNSCGMKFTVVDTSLVRGGDSSSLRELRYLPVEIIRLTSIAKKCSGKDDSSEDGLDEFKSFENTGGSNNSTAKFTVVDTSEKPSKVRELRCLPSVAKNIAKFGDSLKPEKAKKRSSRPDPRGENQTITASENHQFRRRAKPGRSDSVVPVVKRRRLTACSKAKIPDQGMLLGSKQTEKKTILDDDDDDDIKLKILIRKCDSIRTDDNELVSKDVNGSEQGLIVGRRQSTRNRPLTTRALEALANGFLNVQRRSKGVENSISNPCRKARSSKAKVCPASVAAVVSKEDREAGHRGSGNGVGLVEGDWLTTTTTTTNP